MSSGEFLIGFPPEIRSEIQKIADDNKVTFAAAFKAIMKAGMVAAVAARREEKLIIRDANGDREIVMTF